MEIPSWIKLHAAVTHFPIATLLLSVAVEFGAFLLQRAPEKQRVWRQFSLTLVGVAAITFLPGLLTGYLHGRNYSRPPVEYQAHWVAAWISTGLTYLVLVWRLVARDQLSNLGRVVNLVLVVAGATAVGWTGHLGGEMVFGDETESPVAVAIVPAPTPDVRDEKLALFADKLGLVADKMDHSLSRLEKRPQAAPKPELRVVEKPISVPPVVVAPNTDALDRASAKLDKVADKFASVANRLDQSVTKLEKVPVPVPVGEAPQVPKVAVPMPKPGKAAVAAATAVPAATPAAPKGPDPKLVAAGEKLYLNEEIGCTSCHKLNGKGGRGGPALDGTGTRFPDIEWQMAHLKDPPSKVPGSKMPAYNDLKEEDLRALASYMVSLK